MKVVERDHARLFEVGEHALHVRDELLVSSRDGVGVPRHGVHGAAQGDDK